MFTFLGLATTVLLLFAGVALVHFTNGEGLGMGLGYIREGVGNGLPFFYVISHLLPGGWERSYF